MEKTRVRTMYLNRKGEMFLQFYPQNKPDLERLHCRQTILGEPLQSGYQIDGSISNSQLWFERTYSGSTDSCINACSGML